MCAYSVRGENKARILNMDSMEQPEQVALDSRPDFDLAHHLFVFMQISLKERYSNWYHGTPFMTRSFVFCGVCSTASRLVFATLSQLSFADCWHDFVSLWREPLYVQHRQ
jgi:hypothetical protein